MKTITSLIVTVLVSACILFVSVAFGHGPWYVQVDKWPACVVGAAAVAVPAFLLIVLPAFACLRRSKRDLSRTWALAIGAVIGLAVTALLGWIGGVGLSASLWTAGATAGGAGFLTYARFRETPFTRNLGSGVLMAVGGAYLWALVYSLWQQHGVGASPDWLSLLMFPPFFILVSSWFLLPFGGLLGVWMPRFMERSRSWVSFAFGSILGALVGCAAVLIYLVPITFHTIESGITGQQLELVQNSILQSALKNIVAIIPFAAAWVGLWAVKSSRHISHESAARSLDRTRAGRVSFQFGRY